MEWDARCARLSNLRHPLINPLIDYGAFDGGRCFEAYAALDAFRASGVSAERLLAHAARFLGAQDLHLERPLADFVLRPVSCGPPARVRPIGLLLQPRAAFTVISDALDSAGPPGAAVVSIEGTSDSGLRTLRLGAARAARLQGYVAVAPGVLHAFPWLAEILIGRHVCIIADEPPGQNAQVVRLLGRLSAESARRHVVLAFGRPQPGPRHRRVRIDPMGVTAMMQMVFLDREQGPRPGEVFAAARGSDGQPGRCVQALGACMFEPSPQRFMTAHELPQPYDATARVVSPAAGPPDRRTTAALRRSGERSEALARRGRHAAAVRLLSRATRVFTGRGHRDEAARTMLSLGWLSLDRGHVSAAVHAFEEAGTLCSSGPAAVAAAIGLGVAWTDEGRLIEGEAALRTAMLTAQSVDDPQLAIQAAAALGRCLYWQGRLDEAGAVVGGRGDRLPPSTQGARLMWTRARIHLAEGFVAAAVRTARAAVEMARALDDPRALASAYRVLASAVASAGDQPAARSHIEEGLRAAALAHLPLAAIRLRLAWADVPSGSQRSAACRLARRFATGAGSPGLLRFFAQAVLARVDGAELSAETRAFIVASGARTIARPTVCAPANPVADLEMLLELGHAAADDRAAIERIGGELQTRLRAATILVVGASPERRVLSLCGRAWHGDPHVAWRAAGGGVSVAMDPSVEPGQAAEPLKYGGDVIGAVAARWTAGTVLDPERVSALLRVGALALAGSVRAVLDRAPRAAEADGSDILGDSPPTRALRESIARAARAPFPVLVQGESGSGKELVARAIHRLGPRRDRRFCALNCAALSDELIEAELFGHARGAFTGAIGERAGLFEDADGGTLFLDEIAELSARAQAKLLRVLQDGEVRRVGENVSRRVDVRIVAATNRRLDQEAAAGRFRVDLRFRLDVVRIDVPPLRDRPGDVSVLAAQFWNEAAARVGSRATLAPDAVALLARYDWPGNVRELQNVIAWIAVHAPGRGRIGASALPRHLAQATPSPGGTFEAARAEFERRFIKAALASADGRRTRAAEALGISRQGLAKMMRRLGLDEC